MRCALAMVWLDWQLLRRERAALISTLLLPVAVVAILGPVYVSVDAGATRAGVVLATDGPVSRLVERRLVAPGRIEATRFTTLADALSALRERRVDAVVVVPHAVEESGSASVQLIGPPQLEEPRGIRAELERAVAEADVVRRVAADPDSSPERRTIAGVEAAMARAVSQPPDDDTGDRRRQGALAASLVAVVVLFTFLNAMARSAVIPGYRETGALSRLRVAEVSRREICLGFAASLGSYAVVQALVALVSATVFLGVSWPSVATLTLVTVAVGVSAGSLGLLVGTLLPSATAGATVAGPVGFLMGMLGGAVWPLEIVPPWLRLVGHVVPQAWAVDALVAAGGLGEDGGWVVPTLVLLGGAGAFTFGAVVRLGAPTRRD